MMPPEVINPVLTWVITGALGVICVQLKRLLARQKERDKHEDEQMQAMCSGIRTLLRNELIEMHREWAENKGYCTLAVKEYATRLYESYHDCGGNGTGTSMYKDLMALPIRED